MKFILKNIEKIIFAIFLILFIVVVIVAKMGIIKEVAPVSFPPIPEEFKMPEKDRLQLEIYGELVRKIRKPKLLSAYPHVSERNIFWEYEEPKPSAPPFVVKEIQLMPLHIIYQGFIELSDDNLLGQINFEGETHFVKIGDVFANYKVKELTKKSCVVLDSKGKEIRLPCKQRVFREEREALLYDPRTKKLVKVKRGLKIRNYEILDIGASYVVLLNKNGDKIVLKKGEK